MSGCDVVLKWDQHESYDDAECTFNCTNGDECGMDPSNVIPCVNNLDFVDSLGNDCSHAVYEAFPREWCGTQDTNEFISSE